MKSAAEMAEITNKVEQYRSAKQLRELERAFDEMAKLGVNELRWVDEELYPSTIAELQRLGYEVVVSHGYVYEAKITW